jgi:hypothetical protein
MLVRLLDTNPVGKFLEWEQLTVQPVLADLVTDTRVQAALENYAADEVALRESVREFLARRERGRGT